MKFDLVLTNPPFQDSVNRNKTPHKLWIDFTLHSFGQLVAEGGLLCQVSPTSFSSPNSKILTLMKNYQLEVLRLDSGRHFKDYENAPGSTFSDYSIRRVANSGKGTLVVTPDETFHMVLDKNIWYLPNDLNHISLAIHKKVIIDPPEKLHVRWDYVTNHNIRRHSNKVDEVTLSETKSDTFKYAVLHTNNKIWWSSRNADYAPLPKVMWSRSGYMKPFADKSGLAVTDMGYYVVTESDDESMVLAENLSSSLIRYVCKTAKWSGFGNERVFASLPKLPVDKVLTDEEVFDLFKLSEEEREYVREFMA